MERTNRERLVDLSGQVINGMLSADSSVWTKLIDRAIYKNIAKTAVLLASEMLRCIDEEDKITYIEKKKLEIADSTLKIRDLLLGMTHPATRKESEEEYNKENERLQDLMSELDDIEDGIEPEKE